MLDAGGHPQGGIWLNFWVGSGSGNLSPQEAGDRAEARDRVAAMEGGERSARQGAGLRELAGQKAPVNRRDGLRGKPRGVRPWALSCRPPGKDDWIPGPVRLVVY